MLSFNPRLIWVLQFTTEKGIFHVKQRDQARLFACTWDLFMQQPWDITLLSEEERKPFAETGLYSAAGWSLPPHTQVNLFICLRGYGMRSFEFSFEAHQAMLQMAWKCFQNPTHIPQVLRVLPRHWEKIWRQIGLLTQPHLIPEKVAMPPLGPSLLDCLPYADRLFLDPAATQPNPDIVEIQLPAQAEQTWQTAFAPHTPLLLCPDPAYGLLNPFWLREPLEETRDSTLLKLLQAGHLLRSEAKQPTPSVYQRCQKELAEQHYVVLRQLFSPLLLASIRAYVQSCYEQGYFMLGDSFVAGRDSIHNEPLMQLLHRELLKAVNQIVPQAVKSSYSFLSRYQAGAVLPRHTDRELCEWNLSLVLDLQPESEKEETWPIYLETQTNKAQAIYLEIGDGVLYQGTRFPHWRNALPPEHSATVCFFHFVTPDYAGFLY